MKAITTRYIGASEHRPARYVASDLDGNRVSVSLEKLREVFMADHGGRYPSTFEEQAEALHGQVARALCERMEWPGAETWIGGRIKNAMVWIFPPPLKVWIVYSEHRSWTSGADAYATKTGAENAILAMAETCGRVFTDANEAREWLTDSGEFNVIDIEESEVLP